MQYYFIISFWEKAHDWLSAVQYRRHVKAKHAGHFVVVGF